MSSWNDFRLTCMHGVTENLDDHPCPECRKLTDDHIGPGAPDILWKRAPKKGEKVVINHEMKATIDVERVH